MADIKPVATKLGFDRFRKPKAEALIDKIDEPIPQQELLGLNV